MNIRNTFEKTFEIFGRSFFNKKWYSVAVDAGHSANHVEQFY